MRLFRQIIAGCLLAVFLPIFFAGKVFAADFKITGTAIDNENNPVSGTKVAVTNIFTQQIIASTTANQNGYYSLFVPKGTYNIITTPPLSTGLQTITYSHVTISSDIVIHSNLNTVGKAPSVETNTFVQPSGVGINARAITLAAISVILIILIAAGFFVWRKKK